MKIEVCFLLFLQAFADFRDNNELNLSRTERDLISWNRMANNAFALKQGLHSTKNDRANFLARIIEFCLKTKTCNKQIEWKPCSLPHFAAIYWLDQHNSTCKCTYLYMASQETLFAPMKTIQMDSDHQLKINVGDNWNQWLLSSTSADASDNNITVPKN